MVRVLHKIMATVMLLSVFSCGKEENEKILDITLSPMDLVVRVCDKDGNDLLNSDSPQCIVDDLTFVYKGEIYKVANTCDRDALSQVYCCADVIFQVYRDKSELNGIYYVTIGHWNAYRTWEYEEVTVIWPDGTKNELSFTMPKISSSNARCYLDGKEHESRLFEFVK